MGLNVTSLSPTQAKQYWYDYNNGNKKGISNAEYTALCTKFRGYISGWEKEADDIRYTYSNEDPTTRLDYDPDDAGFCGNGKDTAITAGNAVTAAGGHIIVSSGLIDKGVLNFSCKGATGVDKIAGEKLKLYDTKKHGVADKKNTEGNKVNGLLLVVAALQFAMALATKANSPNKDAVEALKIAQEELLTEQALLGEQVANMEEMQEEMTLLQEQAIITNEKGQDEIVTAEGMYHYYYTKYQNGTATPQEIAIMNALATQMQTTQKETDTETQGLNSEIAALGENYQVVSDTVENSGNLTEAVSEMDVATRNNTIIQAALMAYSAFSAGKTAYQCYARASALTGSLFGSWAAIAYLAGAAMAGVATALYTEQVVLQVGEYRNTAEDAIDIRKNTEDIVDSTITFQDVSMEYWEETLDTTSEDNLFTLTPTYATVTAPAGGGTSRSATETGGTTGGTGGTTGTSGTSSGSTFGTITTGGTGSGNSEEEEDKDKTK